MDKTTKEYMERIANPKTIDDLREAIRVSGVASRASADRFAQQTGDKGDSRFSGQVEAWSDALSLVDRLIANQAS